MNRCTYCSRRIWPWPWVHFGWEIVFYNRPVKVYWHSTCRRERTG